MFAPDLLKKLDDEDPEKPEPVKLMIPQRQDLLLALPLRRMVGWTILKSGHLI